LLERLFLVEVSSIEGSLGEVGEMTSLFSLGCSLGTETCSLGKDAGGKGELRVEVGGESGCS
jgi:hypothetical protein